MTRFAPGDYIETVNTKGLPRYAKQVRMRNDKGVEIEIQSNHISICTQPNVLRKGVLSA
ncbi:MAG TPA: major capsid protein [Hyphomicrobium sp.]|nr:major capsid protein [Hyphomicrobium sp.]